VGASWKYSVRLSNTARADWGGRLVRRGSGFSGKENAGVAGASVNPAVEGIGEDCEKNATGKQVEWVGREIDLPIKVLTREAIGDGRRQSW